MQDTLARLLALMAKRGGGGGAGVIIQVDEDVTLTTPNPSWVVPKLTVEQVTQAYNALVAGKHVTVENANGNVQYTVILGDGLTEEPAIILIHYWLGFVDYQITNDKVVITAHEISDGTDNEMTITFTEDDYNEETETYVKHLEFNNTYFKVVFDGTPLHEDAGIEIYNPYFKGVGNNQNIEGFTGLDDEPQNRSIYFESSYLGGWYSIFNGVINGLMTQL